MHFEARGLRRRVDARELFAELALAVAPGETLLLRGASGSGKTLLLRGLARLDPLDGGALTLDGRDSAEWSPCEWRSQVCYVAQRPPQLPGTPAEHAAAIAALGSQRGRDADDPRALASAWGLDAEAFDRPWSRLSGGEGQRAALAIAVARRPVLLLLDEPTSALDAEATAAVEGSLRGRSAIWVTHDDAQAERLGGQVVELGATP